MTTKILAYLRSNLIALLALFIALGGTGYAAFSLPAGSVGNRQLKNHSISPIKLDRSAIGGYVRYWAEIDSAGAIVASRPRAHLAVWHTAEPAAFLGGLVQWGGAIPADCFASATTLPSPPDHFVSSASAVIFGAGQGRGPEVGAYVYLSAPQTGVSVAVICPQP